MLWSMLVEQEREKISFRFVDLENAAVSPAVDHSTRVILLQIGL